jgi:hypothetical protein
MCLVLKVPSGQNEYYKYSHIYIIFVLTSPIQLHSLILNAGTINNIFTISKGSRGSDMNASKSRPIRTFGMGSHTILESEAS